MSSPVLILASASPRRAELLQQLGLEFQIIPSQAQEVQSDQLTAGEVARINAFRKALTVSKKYPDAITLGVDTVVTLGNKIFGKPASVAEAEEMLLTMSGKLHQVVTGVCVLHLRAHRQRRMAIAVVFILMHSNLAGILSDNRVDWAFHLHSATLAFPSEAAAFSSSKDIRNRVYNSLHSEESHGQEVRKYP